MEDASEKRREKEEIVLLALDKQGNPNTKLWMESVRRELSKKSSVAAAYRDLLEADQEEVSRRNQDEINAAPNQEMKKYLLEEQSKLLNMGRAVWNYMVETMSQDVREIILEHPEYVSLVKETYSNILGFLLYVSLTSETYSGCSNMISLTS